MTTSTFTTTHIRVQTEKQFGEVTRDFERQLGKFDPAVFQGDRQVEIYPGLIFPTSMI